MADPTTPTLEPQTAPASDAALTDKDDTMTSSRLQRMRDGPLGDKIRDRREKLSSQAGEKARDLVGQGLERTAETLGNVSKMIGDTATGIDERLGEEYGDYARKAATALDKAGKTIASKSPDELIEDTRDFVRNSPGIALAGAAVVGFVVARLFKSGLAPDDED
jgi:ElaB/YqjD/DUF883 family membrane-anchored ribosome-binding protein